MSTKIFHSKTFGNTSIRMNTDNLWEHIGRKKHNKVSQKEHEEKAKRMYHEWRDTKLEEDMNDVNELMKDLDLI